MVKWDYEHPSGLRKRVALLLDRTERLNMSQVDEHQSSGKISLGLSVIVRVTLRDGTYHEVQGGELHLTGEYADRLQGCGLRTY